MGKGEPSPCGDHHRGKIVQSMKKIKIVVGPWEMYHYRRENGMLCVVSFDLGLAQSEPIAELNQSYRIVLHLLPENTQAGGLPVEGMVVQLEDIERDLVKSLETAKVNCRMVGRQTYEGKREMVFQVENGEHFEQIYGIWAADFTDFKVEQVQSEGWDFFEQHLKPTMMDWQQVVDRRMIEKLLKAGSNPSKVHELEHTITGEMESLQIMAEELAHGGFTVAELGGGELVVKRASYLNVEEISMVTSALFRFAHDLGLVYEGWGARVVE